jgi:hypothetical protein
MLDFMMNTAQIEKKNSAIPAAILKMKGEKKHDTSQQKT